MRKLFVGLLAGLMVIGFWASAEEAAPAVAAKSPDAVVAMING